MMWSDVRAVYAQDRRLVVSTVLGLGIVALCGALIAQLMDEVSEDDDLTRFDQELLDVVVEHRTPWWNGVARNVTHLGDPWLVTAVVAAVALALVVWRRYHLAAFVVLASGGAAVVSSVTKQVFDRPRPPTSLWLGTAWGPSFPSGHATQSIACWGAVAVVACVLVRSRAARAAIIGAAVCVALAVGTSRVYLAVHWASDVICGWAISLMWLTALLLAGWSTPRARGAWSSAQAADPGEVEDAASWFPIDRPRSPHHGAASSLVVGAAPPLPVWRAARRGTGVA
jgi:undecaprenyl-diphosphatase